MNKQQIGVIFVAIIFLGSTAGFAFFSAPRERDEDVYKKINYTEYPPTYGPYSEEFLHRNIFSKEIPEPVQVNMLMPHQPSDYPNQPYERIIGGVFLQYSCKNCPSLVKKLENVTRTYSPRVYLAPYYRMNSTIALTAYRKSLKMESFNHTKIENFICENLRISKPDRCTFREIYS